VIVALLSGDLGTSMITAVVWVLLPAAIVAVVVVLPTFVALEVVVERLRLSVAADIALAALCSSSCMALWLSVAAEPPKGAVIVYGAFAGVVGRSVQLILSSRVRAV
jgi:hypothetical protein